MGHEHFNGEKHLGCAKTAKGAGRDPVGSYDPAMNLQVWDAVYSGSGEHAALEYDCR